MASNHKVFMRDATGLVRSLGFFDQFIISQSIVIILNGFVPAMVFAPYFFPGANLALVFLLGTIPAFAMAAVYAALSGAMPRSGGDYVWSSRILGPLYGSMQFVMLFATTMVLGSALSNYWAVTIGLSQLAFSLGITTGNSGLIGLSAALSQPSLGYPISVMLYVGTMIIALFGLRIFAWFQKIATVVYLVVTAVFIMLLFTMSSSTFPALFDHAMQIAGSNATYTGIIQQASAGGLSPQFNWNNTLLAAIPWGFLTYTNFNFGTYLAGETKNARSSLSKALFLSTGLTCVCLIIMSLQSYNLFGSTFLNAASYVESTNPSALPALPTTTLMVSLTNPLIAFLMGFGIFLGYVIGITGLFITMSRMLFAASFDRLIPARFANVDEKFHSPQLAIVATALIWIAWITVFWWAGFAATYLNAAISSPIGYLMPLVAAFLFPILKPDLFKRTVGALGRNAELSVIVGSIVGIFAFAVYILAETFPIISGVFLGANLAIAYGFVLGLGLVGVIIYFVAKTRTRRMGIDIGKTYEEIPPE